MPGMLLTTRFVNIRIARCLIHSFRQLLWILLFPSDAWYICLLCSQAGERLFAEEFLELMRQMRIGITAQSSLGGEALRAASPESSHPDTNLFRPTTG